MRLVRGLSGVVAAGVVVLACVVVGAAILGHSRNFPGPGEESIGWHVGAAVAVIVAQVVADRRRGAVALLGSLAVFVVTGALLWTQWWS